MNIFSVFKELCDFYADIQKFFVSTFRVWYRNHYCLQLDIATQSPSEMKI